MPKLLHFLLLAQKPLIPTLLRRSLCAPNNDELVSGWGNLVNRVATLIHKNFGEIPAVDEAFSYR